MIGALRHRVTFKHLTRAADGGGGFVDSWANIPDTPTVYAAMAQISAQEHLRFHKLEVVVTHRMTVRHRKDVTPEMRVQCDGVDYDIMAVSDHAGDGRYLNLFVAAV